MDKTEIYNLPDERLSGQWGARQAIYDQQMVQGLVGPPEIAAAQAAKTPALQSRPAETDLLTGRLMRTSFAEIEVMPGWAEVRWRDHVEAPSLGSREKREADLKILSTIAGSEPVARAIEQTMRDNEDIRWIRALMGSVLSG